MPFNLSSEIVSGVINSKYSCITLCGLINKTSLNISLVLNYQTTYHTPLASAN